MPDLYGLGKGLVESADLLKNYALERERQSLAEREFTLRKEEVKSLRDFRTEQLTHQKNFDWAKYGLDSRGQSMEWEKALMNKDLTLTGIAANIRIAADGHVWDWMLGEQRGGQQKDLARMEIGARKDISVYEAGEAMKRLQQEAKDRDASTWNQAHANAVLAEIARRAETISKRDDADLMFRTKAGMEIIEALAAGAAVSMAKEPNFENNPALKNYFKVVSKVAEALHTKKLKEENPLGNELLVDEPPGFRDVVRKMTELFVVEQPKYFNRLVKSGLSYANPFLHPFAK